MRVVLFVAALSLIAAFAMADPPTLEFTDQPWGRLAIAEMESAPYPHPSRAEGYASRTTFFPCDPHYIDSSVALLVPNGYEARDTVDLIVHFHGHQNHLTQLIPMFRLGEELEASGRNAIMIVPQGPRDASDSRNGKLDEPGGFTALIEESLAALHASGVTHSEEPGRIVIMGHSGGFYTLGQVIALGEMADHVLELYLWDAAYAQRRHFANFAERPETRMISIFTEHLASRNGEIMDDLRNRGVPILVTVDSQISDAQLASERTIFLSTELGHNAVIMGTHNLERWLRTSGLSSRP